MLKRILNAIFEKDKKHYIVSLDGVLYLLPKEYIHVFHIEKRKRKTITGFKQFIIDPNEYSVTEVYI